MQPAVIVIVIVLVLVLVFVIVLVLVLVFVLVLVLVLFLVLVFDCVLGFVLAACGSIRGFANMERPVQSSGANSAGQPPEKGSDAAKNQLVALVKPAPVLHRLLRRH